SLSLQWPYCLRRCTYCNFNKYVWRGGSEDLRGSEEDMRGCLQREAETLLQLSQVSRITSVFFGGGTPSLASPATIAAVLETLAKHAHLPGNVEVTLEVNPTPVGVARLSEFHRAGVNRFSIGVQCLNDADLQLLGRDHSSQHALQALAEARRLCPGRVSVDVIFGRPGQSVLSWESELGRLLALCDDHVSLYQLTLERGTALFSQVRRGELSVPGEDDTARMYEVARGLLGHAGFRQYEVSNFARNGAISVHNQGYWRARQYIGVGPGAHSRFSPRGAGGQRREARTQTLEPEVWMREVRRCGHGTRRRLELDTLELLEEVLVMGLRMTEGIPHERWLQFCPWGSLGEVMEGSSEVRELLERGLLILDRR
ncbi:RSAD1 protein, partial [Amia calva]|nr:RSAD1 protein [Amia calva]